MHCRGHAAAARSTWHAIQGLRCTQHSCKACLLQTCHSVSQAERVPRQGSWGKGEQVLQGAQRAERLRKGGHGEKKGGGALARAHMQGNGWRTRRKKGLPHTAAMRRCL